MIKWFAYVVMLVIFAPRLSFASTKNNCFSRNACYLYGISSYRTTSEDTIITKNTKKPLQDDKGKIKEVTKAKKQPRPEKIGQENSAALKTKQRPKRQRRPEGLERPPEIPRRSGN